MIILTIRTDKPEAEVGVYENEKRLAYEKWPAHRQLAETIHTVIAKNLQLAGVNIQDLQAIIVFRGPGSFTGLRIGLSVANALADSLKIPIVGTAEQDWIDDGISRILAGEKEDLVLPDYGSPPHITKQKK